MLLQHLLETPEYIDKELKREHAEQRRISVQAFDREFDLLNNKQFSDGQTAVYGIRKDKSAAIAGEVRNDEDGGKYIAIMVHLDFHQAPTVGELPGTVLQVDTVIASPEMKSYGHGYNLYHACASKGYTLVSDNVQYIGGRKLWDKIIRNGQQDGMYVYIMQDGKLRRDERNVPIRFDGVNIPQNQIWGKPGSIQHHNALLAMTNKSLT